jgi:large subunit ribosomal protein L1
MATATKRAKQNASLVETRKAYRLEEAIEALKKAAPVKFDPSVDLQLKLGADPNATEQTVRGTTLLPHGTGRKVRVVVLTKDEAGKAAEAAGADFVGGADLIEKIVGGWLEFDAVVASPSMMREVGKLGKVLGPRGLMPSPKAGTVTENLAQAVKEIKQGRIEFKMDKQANLHVSVGKLSFATAALAENARALLAAVAKARPKDFKGEFIKSAHLSSTMGPGLKLEPSLYKTQEESGE